MIRLSDLIPENSLRHTGPGIARYTPEQHKAIRRLEDQLANYQSMMKWNFVDVVDYKHGPDETLAISIENDQNKIYIEPWVKDQVTTKVYDKNTRLGSRVFTVSDVKGILHFIKTLTMGH